MPAGFKGRLTSPHDPVGLGDDETVLNRQRERQTETFEKAMSTYEPAKTYSEFG